MVAECCIYCPNMYFIKKILWKNGQNIMVKQVSNWFVSVVNITTLVMLCFSCSLWQKLILLVPYKTESTILNVTIAQVRFNSRYWLHCHLNLRVSGTKIENLRWQFGEDINFITFRKFLTLLAQQLKKQCVLQQGIAYQPVYWHLFLSFWTIDVTNFSNVTQIVSPLNCHLRFSIVVLETFKFKEKGLAI